MSRHLTALLRALETRMFNRRIRNALKLHLRGEVRADGLPLKSVSSSVELEWRARNIHPWDRALGLKDADARFVRQSIKDTAAAITRLFATLPHVDALTIRIYEPNSDRVIMSGEVLRSSLSPDRPLSERIWLGQLGMTFHIIDDRFQPLSSGQGSDRGSSNYRTLSTTSFKEQTP
jgi:hypothetical protein